MSHVGGKPGDQIGFDAAHGRTGSVRRRKEPLATSKRHARWARWRSMRPHWTARRRSGPIGSRLRWKVSGRRQRAPKKACLKSSSPRFIEGTTAAPLIWPRQFFQFQLLYQIRHGDAYTQGGCTQLLAFSITYGDRFLVGRKQLRTEFGGAAHRKLLSDVLTTSTRLGKHDFYNPPGDAPRLREGEIVAAGAFSRRLWYRWRAQGPDRAAGTRQAGRCAGDLFRADGAWSALPARHLREEREG